MDSFDIGTFKLEKARTAQRSNIRKIVNFLRVIEFCIVLMVISRLTSQVPFTVKSSGEYFRGLKFVLVSPAFVFVLGNLIVVTLFTKSGKSSAAMEIDCFYEECVEKSQRSLNREVDAHRRIKTYRRVRSEKFIGHKNDGRLSGALHRSKTVKCSNSFDCGEKPEETSFAEDAMSNEEFRRVIEDFIARQQKFRMEEEHHAA